MMKGVKFGEFHSLTDWNSALRKKPDISAPEAKTTYVDVPGRSGSIDLTEALGPLTYKMRTITMDFKYLGNIESWASMYSEILNSIQGKELHIILDDDNKWYYVGRPQITKWTPNRHFVDFTIKALVQPYKLSIMTYDEWKWDPFNFNEDVALDREYNITDDIHRVIMIYSDSTYPIKAIFNSTVDAILGWDGQSYSVPANTATTITLNAPVGLSIITAKAVSGSGTITIDYTRGKL